MKVDFNVLKRKLGFSLMFVIAIPVLTLSQGFSPQTASRLQNIIDSFQNNPANPYIGGMSAAINVDGLAYWEGATGYAARNVDGDNKLLTGGVPFTTSTLSRMYSITKTFTAALVIELANEGALSLHDVVAKYIPFLSSINPELNGSVTIKQLLGHESGYSDYTTEQMLQIAVAFQPARQWTPFETLSFVHQINAPGEVRKYSSTNYIVLGVIIESATNKTLEQHFRERFFIPLDLNSMYLDIRESQPPGSLLASPHDNISPFNPIFQMTGQPIFPDTITNISAFPFTAISSLEFASGGLISNISDISDWGNSLFGGRATNQTTIDLMVHSISTIPDQDGDFLGYGIFRTTRISETDIFIGHDGNAPGYRSIMFYQPDIKMTIAIFTNFSGARLYDVAKALYEALPEITCGNKNRKELKILVTYNNNNLCVDRGAAAKHIEKGGYLGSNQINGEEKASFRNSQLNGERSLIKDPELIIYPNPANNMVGISLRPQVTGRIELSLYDLNGKRISVIQNDFMEKGSIRNIEFNAIQLPAGVYFVKMTSNSQVFQKKLVINR